MLQDTSGSLFRVYLLTIWPERSHDPQAVVQWRFSLEHPATGQRRAFARLEALVAALKEATSEGQYRAGKEEAS